MTLLQMAFQQPDRICSMTLVSAAPYFPESSRNIMKQATLESHTKKNGKQCQDTYLWR